MKKDTILDYDYSPTKSELKKCYNKQEKEALIFKKLTKESKQINFNSLAAKIIKDLNYSDFSGDVILFFFRYDKMICGSFDEDKFICKKEYNTTNPFYSMENWDYRDIILLSKKLSNKIIVPSEKDFGFSISNRLFGIKKKDKIDKYPEFKLGIVNDKEANMGSKDFYYLSERQMNENLLLKTDYIYNEVLNYSYDTLYFKFENLLGFKVKILQYINFKQTTKIYEYNNKEWNLVESE